MLIALVSRIASAGAALVLVLAIIAPSVARAETAAVEPAALETLRRMTEYVGGLERSSLETESMLEEVLDAREQKIQYDCG